MIGNDGFDINIIGDLRKGRPTLGNSMSVAVYRLIVYSLRAELINRFGKEEVENIFYQSGQLIGETVHSSFMVNVNDESELYSSISSFFLNAKIGRFEVKKSYENGEMLFSLSEDIDCSGLASDGETKCSIDEGIISGILSSFYQKTYITKEVGCWGTGEKSCFFKSVALKESKS
jgi:uncharacterized protein